MPNIKDKFERREVKYLISAEQRRDIMKLVEEYMKPDEFGRSAICSVYYDTPDMLLIRRSLDRPVYKEKLRVRSYGPVSGDKAVFVELKKKYNGVVYKRRVAMTAPEAEAYLAGETAAPQSSQIVSELDYFLKQYPGLAPAAYIAYDRQAFFGRDDPDFRITFDENIRWRDEDISLSADTAGEQLLAPGQSLMEIKIADAMPLWLAHELSALGVFKTSFSKYGGAYRAMCARAAVPVNMKIKEGCYIA